MGQLRLGDAWEALRRRPAVGNRDLSPGVREGPRLQPVCTRHVQAVYSANRPKYGETSGQAATPPSE